ncbi:hypothetical protein AALP_AA8G072500 [Arabis alpina]|uniref:Uncharacterized protein n=1 Tax=Arabis alpina TaxID=50452 RepID=A0A087G5J9_ARAAL|nr:hypothetical protein AALP_AA8G072500 [Arabis alpina]
MPQRPHSQRICRCPQQIDRMGSRQINRPNPHSKNLN